MNRREKLLHGISTRDSVCVEIGALCRPFLRREDGTVIYVDHADTEKLRSKYRDDPNVDAEKIVNVDAVWGSNTLFEAIQKKVDYIVASHVIEHVPDLIGWLNELASILNKNGEVRLIIPDRRFTFDYLRNETRLPEVLYANLMRARIPQAHIVFEYVMNVVKLDRALAWRGQVNPEVLEYKHSYQMAERCARSILRDHAYHDVHCWVFTPSSFASLFAELAARKLIQFECTSFFDTARDTNEFFVGLKQTSDYEHAVRTWQDVVSRAADVKTEPEESQGRNARNRLLPKVA